MSFFISINRPPSLIQNLTNISLLRKCPLSEFYLNQIMESSYIESAILNIELQMKVLWSTIAKNAPKIQLNGLRSTSSKSTLKLDKTYERTHKKIK